MSERKGWRGTVEPAEAFSEQDAVFPGRQGGLKTENWGGLLTDVPPQLDTVYDDFSPLGTLRETQRVKFEVRGQEKTIRILKQEIALFLKDQRGQLCVLVDTLPSESDLVLIYRTCVQKYISRLEQKGLAVRPIGFTVKSAKEKGKFTITFEIGTLPIN